VQAQDVMSRSVAAVVAEAAVKDAARLMIERGVSALPVVDGANRVVGIVSEGDLIRRAEIGTARRRPLWLMALLRRSAREYVKARAARVRDVMTRPVVTVAPAAPLHEVAGLLEKHRIKRVPVVKGGRLAGIVSRADLVRRLAAAPEAPTARTARDRALRRAVLERLERAGVRAVNLNATVRNGVVHLWGEVASRGEQMLLRRAALAVDGVREVQDRTAVMPPPVAAELGLL
jgi:CBS-domain-containing membrane protein